MATRGLDLSIKDDHEFFYDWRCSKCEEDDHMSEAIAYCKNCDEGFCDSCLKSHNKFTKGHKVLGQEDKANWGEPAPNYDSGVVCLEHPGQTISMYCGNHDEVCCPVCAVMHHGDVCRPKMSYIPDAAKGLASKSEFREFKTDGDQLLVRIAHIEEEKALCQSAVNASRVKCSTDIEEIEEMVVQRLKDLRKTSLSEINQLHNEEEKKILSELDTCADMKKQLNDIKQKMQTTATVNEASLFVTMKTGQKKLHIYREKCEELCETQHKTYTFDRSQELTQLARSTSYGKCVEMEGKRKDAERVCKQDEHFINQSNFSVSLCLDLDSSLVFILPCPIELHDMDTHLKGFLLGNKPYCDDLDAEVSRCHGLVHWPKMTDDCIKISCSVNKNDTEGRQKVENWSAKCMAAVNKVLDKLAVDDSFHIAREAWKMFKERLGEISIDDPDKVAVYLKKESHGMVVAGETMIVKDICTQVRKLGAELEQQLEEGQQSITKSRRVKRFQIILLTASRFLDMFKKSQVTIEMSHENAEVVFQGSRVAVDKAMEKMCEIIQSFPKKQIQNFRKPAIDLLFLPDTRCYIKRRLSQKKVYGVWDLTRDNTLELYSKNEADLEVAASVLTTCMKQKTIPLDSYMQAITLKPEWQKMLKKLDEGRGNQYKLELKPGELYIAGIDAGFNEIVTEIQGAFDLHSVLSDFIEMDAGKFRFMDRYKKAELDDIQKQYLRLKVQVSTVDEVKRKGVRVKGTKDGCQLAVQKIKNLLYNIHMQDCEVKHPYVNQFMASAQAKEDLRKIEMYHNCVLEVAHPRGSSNAPVEPQPLAKCHLGPVKVAVVEGDMTNMIADAIVNPTNKQLDYKIGLSAAIMAKDPFKQKKTMNQTSVTVYVYADSQTNMGRATRALEGLMSDEEHCYGDKSVLRKLDIRKVKELQDRYRKDSIELWVDDSRRYIKLRGYSKALAAAKPHIARFITEQEKDIKRQEKQETRSTVAVRLPGHWTTLSPDSPMQVIGLTQYDQEYAVVASRFHQETANALAILKMERVESPKLYCQYAAKKRKMEDHPNEKILWHAPSEKSRSMINLMGFSSNISKTRTNWGDGPLFAVSAQTCAVSCQRDMYGQGHMYLTNVLVGDYCVGKQFIGVPPLKPSGGMYDSTADNLISPSIYVIFDDAQAYPAYHLVFQ